METLIKEQRMKKYIYYCYTSRLKACLFDSKSINLISLLFMLSGKSSVLGNQPANNIGSDSTVAFIKLYTSVRIDISHKLVMFQSQLSTNSNKAPPMPRSEAQSVPHGAVLSSSRTQNSHMTKYSHYSLLNPKKVH